MAIRISFLSSSSKVAVTFSFFDEILYLTRKIKERRERRWLEKREGTDGQEGEIEGYCKCCSIEVTLPPCKFTIADRSIVSKSNT